MPRIAVAGPSGVVTDAAVTVGGLGGSVVDVAIVAGLTAMCTEPGVCGPGGGGFLTVDLPGERPVVIDGYMAYPGSGFTGEPRTREVEMTYGGGVTTLVDAGSVAVPGVFAALAMASERFGRLPWSILMETVAGAVEGGFPLSSPCHVYLSGGAAPIYQSDPVARAALFDGDSPKPAGSTIVFPGLADTLRHIGAAGAADLYVGDLGRSIVDDLAGRGAQLTREDMSSYRALPREPLRTSWGDWRLALNPEPSIGGATVQRLIDIGGDSDPGSWASALVTVFAERRNSALESPSTVSVAAADVDGGVVAASFSAGYGSGLIPAGTGMLMNNSVGELELARASGKPGERMVSNMAPTVARRGSDAIAVGSPGAERIITAVATTLIRLTRGDSLQQAIDHPRLHPELGEFGIRLAAEPGQDLDGVTWPVNEYEAPHMYFGGVNGAGLVDGGLQAHADARRTGSVAFTD